MRVNLSEPFDHHGTTITGVTLRRAKAKDMVKIADLIPTLSKMTAKAPDADGAAAPESGAATDISGFDGSVIKALIAVVSILGDVTEECAGEMGFEDLVEVASKAMDFLSGPKSAGGA